MPPQARAAPGLGGRADPRGWSRGNAPFHPPSCCCGWSGCEVRDVPRPPSSLLVQGPRQSRCPQAGLPSPLRTVCLDGWHPRVHLLFAYLKKQTRVFLRKCSPPGPSHAGDPGLAKGLKIRPSWARRRNGPTCCRRGWVCRRPRASVPSKTPGRPPSPRPAPLLCSESLSLLCGDVLSFHPLLPPRPASWRRDPCDSDLASRSGLPRTVAFRDFGAQRGVCVARGVSRMA